MSTNEGSAPANEYLDAVNSVEGPSVAFTLQARGKNTTRNLKAYTDSADTAQTEAFANFVATVDKYRQDPGNQSHVKKGPPFTQDMKNLATTCTEASDGVTFLYCGDRELKAYSGSPNTDGTERHHWKFSEWNPSQKGKPLEFPIATPDDGEPYPSTIVTSRVI